MIYGVGRGHRRQSRGKVIHIIHGVRLTDVGHRRDTGSGGGGGVVRRRPMMPRVAI